MRAPDLFADYQNSFNRQITKANDLLSNYRKRINSPYRKKDFIPIVGTIIILIAIPLTVFSARQAKNFLTRAAGPAAVEAESASFSGSVSVGNDPNASGGQYIEFGTVSSGFQPSAPYYATFFYPWSENPNTDGRWSYWNDNSHTPPQNWFSNYLPDPDPAAFDPPNELYSSNNDQILYWQLGKLAEAKQEVAISSWWGQGHKTDNAFSKIVTDVMNRADNPYPNLRWTIYYEKEGFGDPTVSEIVSDLNHIKSSYASQPAYLKVNNKPVIFVYGDATDGSGMASRWAQAKSQVDFYVVLKVYPGYASEPNQPDSWHQYAPAVRSDNQSPYSYAVSPGFWKDGEAVRLGRDLNSFRSAVSNMVAANATWKLTETWNEWGEGSSVEPGEQVIQTTSGSATLDPSGAPFKNQYVQALKDFLPALESGTGMALREKEGKVAGEVLQAGSFVFTAAGDYANGSNAQSVVSGIVPSGSNLHLALGDLAYGSNWQSWCDMVKQRIPVNFPYELISGNHDTGESDPNVLTNTNDLSECLPHQISNMTEGQKINGSAYALEYYFDYPNTTSPVARFILISPGIKGAVNYSYTRNNSHYNWVRNAILDARNKAVPWVIVGMHKNCITNGVKSCAIGGDLLNLLAGKDLDKNASYPTQVGYGSAVDLILQGHEHSYHRSKQFKVNSTNCTAIQINGYDADCVVNNGPTTFAKGQGVVLDIIGTGGVGLRTISGAGDSEAGYFNAWMGSNVSYPTSGKQNTYGFAKFVVDNNTITASFVPTSGLGYTDNFSIVGGPPDTEPPTVPTNLTATAISGNQVDLSWSASSDNVGVTSYKIFRDGTQIDTSSSTTYSDTSVQPSTTYSYTVAAVDAANNTSPQSSAASVTTPCGLPIDKGIAATSVDLPAAGTYKVWSRIMAPNATNNSYFIQLDGDCGTVVGDSSIPTDTWTWVDYKDGNTASKITKSLPSGVQQVNLVGRETGVKLDRVIFTTDLSCVPTGTGDNCLDSGDVSPPIVSITSPTDGATVSGSVNVTTTASDNIAVTKVEFYVDGSLKSTDTVSPYSYSWDTTTVSNGSHTIQAKAYDGANNVGTDSITVTVDNVVGKTGDLNGDGKVNIFDASIMTSKWGTNDPTADLNGDGTVNIFDASILTANWTG